MPFDKRESGILLHISSLPSNYGIGKLGKNAKLFVDFLKKSRTKYWQILPLSQTSYGDSPYQSFSIHAGNPYFIDFEILEDKALLKKSDYDNINWGQNPRKVDYNAIYNNCYPVLRKAYSNTKTKDIPFVDFCEKNAYWLDDYALFMALKDAYKGASWYNWPLNLAKRQVEAIKIVKEKYEDDIRFYKYLQFWFFEQWKNLKEYANSQGVKIIGDMPIYVAYDSVEVWTKPELFDLTKDGRPSAVAGCPPDDFSITGQLWGNPLYNWSYMKKTDYSWWKERINASKEFYDVLRIDHFRGFESYYAIPATSPTAEEGEWRKGPGMDLFNALKEELEGFDIIAEDLGFITPEVRALLDATGFPGMKVLQFGFDTDGTNEHMTHNFKTPNCIVYTGTHDNDTIMGWYEHASNTIKKNLKRYFKIRNKADVPECMIRTAWGSTAILAVAQIQDFLAAQSARRMNTPSTLGGNWDYRTISSDFSARFIKHLCDLNEVFNRVADAPETVATKTETEENTDTNMRRTERQRRK